MMVSRTTKHRRFETGGGGGRGGEGRGGEGWGKWGGLSQEI